jgi:hypothetical protein
VLVIVCISLAGVLVCRFSLVCVDEFLHLLKSLSREALEASPALLDDASFSHIPMMKSNHVLLQIVTMERDRSEGKRERVRSKTCAKCRSV